MGEETKKLDDMTTEELEAMEASAVTEEKENAPDLSYDAPTIEGEVIDDPTDEVVEEQSVATEETQETTTEEEVPEDHSVDLDVLNQLSARTTEYREKIDKKTDVEGDNQSIEAMRKELGGMEKMLKKVKDDYSRNMSKLKRGEFDEVENLIDEVQEESTPTQPADIDAVVAKAVQQAIEPLQQEKAVRALFTEAKDLQSKYEYFKTKDSLEVIEANPSHPEYKKVAEIAKVFEYRNKNMPRMSASDAYMFLRIKSGKSGEDIKKAKAEGRNEIIENLRKRENSPVTLGSDGSTGESRLDADTIKSPRDLNKLSTEDLQALELSAIAEEEKDYAEYEQY